MRQQELIRLYQLAIENGFGTDGNHLKPAGWKVVAEGFEERFELLVKMNWTISVLKGRLKSKMAALVLPLQPIIQ